MNSVRAIKVAEHHEHGAMLLATRLLSALGHHDERVRVIASSGLIGCRTVAVRAAPAGHPYLVSVGVDPSAASGRWSADS